MIRALAASRLLEGDQQRNHGDGGNHHKLVVVHIGDDLRLLRNRGVERRPTGGRKGFQSCAMAGLSNDRLTAVTCAAISA
jgi:hypothetical protein